MFRWLGQQVLHFQRDHLYRSRWLVANVVPLTSCASLPISQIIRGILDMPQTGPSFPADLFVATTQTDLDTRTPPWPADRRDVPGRAPFDCVVWAEMRAAGDVDIPETTFSQSLRAVNGRLYDLWDQTSGEFLIRPSAPPVPPGTVPTPPVSPPPTVSKKRRLSEPLIAIGLPITLGVMIVRAIARAS